MAEGLFFCYPRFKAKPMKKHPQNPGFTLIEVLFAMVFLTGIVFATVRLFTGQLLLAGRQTNAVEAQALVDEALKAAQMVGPGRVSDLCSGAPLPCAFFLKKSGSGYDFSADPEGEIRGLFTRILTADAVLPPPPAGKKAFLLSAQVTWKDSKDDVPAAQGRVLIFD